jgi:quercetin dioxygenase-like cupin family protein
MEVSNLERLEELTLKLPDMVMGSVGSYVEYAVEPGYAVGLGLYTSPEVSIQRVCFDPGTRFPMHCHDEYETLIVYSGSCTLRTPTAERVLDTGDSVALPPRTPHEILVGESPLRMVAVAVPKGAGFPNA